MRDVETLITEYCAHNLPAEPIWITILNRWFPKITARMDYLKSAQFEIEDHLRNSHEAYLAKGHGTEEAWRLAKEHFGNIDLISKEICRARALSCKCLTVRLIAIGILFILSLNFARIRFRQFLHPESLCLMAVCVTVGYLITRKRDMDSLRKYAIYGAWIGVFWGIIRAITLQNLSTLGAAVAMILMSTFYGLFLAVPSARGWGLAAMTIGCQLGMSIAFMRLGFMTLYPTRLDPTLPILGLGAMLCSLLVGLTVFDIRRLHQRLAGLAVFGMVFAWIDICVDLTGAHSILELVFATSIPVMLSFMIELPIRKLQGCLLKEAD
jgi:hypothetical protein